MSRDGERGGILARIRRFFSGEGPAPEVSAPTLFTATRFPSSAAPPGPSEPLFSSAPARERDLWDEPAVAPPEPDEPAEPDEPDELLLDPDPLEQLEQTEEAGDEDGEVSVAALTDELSRLAVDDGEPEPLFASHPRPHVSDAPDGPAVNIHGERIDTRPGPIRMTPSEAIALAKEGPAALRRRRPPR